MIRARGGVRSGLLAGLALLLAPAAGAMEAAAAALAERLGALERLHGRFEQSLLDGRGVLLQHATGTFWADRPDRFRWETEAPFPEVLIGDGETLWLWDPDLEQVTIRPWDERLEGTPARLLSGAPEDLVDGFEVTLLEDDGARAAFSLRPLAEYGLFERLELVFEAALPTRLVIHDGLGQRTEVTLRDVTTSFEADPERYRFEIPEGADVIRDPAVSPAPAGDD
jgi:outer membrane lipoprotein carrier protein